MTLNIMLRTQNLIFRFRKISVTKRYNNNGVIRIMVSLDKNPDISPVEKRKEYKKVFFFLLTYLR
jgi:hypothetical protein